jgi:hypothetical protein
MIKKSKSGLLQALLNEEELTLEELMCLKNTLDNAGINISEIEEIKIKEEIKNKSKVLNEIIMDEYTKECILVKELCIR